MNAPPTGFAVNGAEFGRRHDFDFRSQMFLEAEPSEIAALVLDGANIHRWCAPVFMHCECVEPGAPDGRGMRLRFHTKGWMPHSFVFEALVADGRRHRHMKIAVSGDFDGFGEMWLVPERDETCRIDIRWCVNVRQRWIGWAARSFPGIFARNHVWAMRNLQGLLQVEILRRRGRVEAESPRPTFPHNIPGYQALQRRICGRFALPGS